ncbi:MAG: hypothetical protein ABIQ06_03145 [Caldimonas sp.]
MSLTHDLTPQTGIAASSSRLPFWATSAFDGTAETSPMELSALGAHIDRCNGLRGPMFGLRCAADTLSGFLAPRIVTVLVAVAIVLGVGSLIV